MVELAIMIEGQDGLNWQRWQRLARAIEDFGFVGLYRSDHYTNSNPPDKDSLELWVSLTWLASHTKRIEFGPLVSPVSFRHPTMTARMAAAVDDLSGGRLTLGLGAGWQEREHQNYGWDLLDIPERFNRFEEGLEVISRLLNNDQPSNFKGRYFHIQDAILLPHPNRPGGPPILIGGNGIKRTLPLVAKYADEWNALYIPLDEIEKRNQILDYYLATAGRNNKSIKRSLMTGCIYDEDSKQLSEKVAQRTKGKRSKEDLISRGLIVGTPTAVIDQINRIAEVGIYRIMLQWLAMDDINGLESLAKNVLPQLQSL